METSGPTGLQVDDSIVDDDSEIRSRAPYDMFEYVRESEKLYRFRQYADECCAVMKKVSFRNSLAITSARTMA